MVYNELDRDIVQIVRYTPAQIKEALEISEETLRHWRKTLPPLRGKRGYSPCFSPGDLLALKVVAQFHVLGVNVSQLASHAAGLFTICSQGVWSRLESKTLISDGQRIELVPTDEEREWAQQARIVVPLGPLIRQLQRRLSEEEVHFAQTEIVFPPVGIAQGRAK